MSSGAKRMKIESDVKKEIFKKIACDFRCSFCSCLPCKGPMYLSTNGNGNMACLNCKNNGKLPYSVEMPGSWKIFEELPFLSCRNQKNGCRVIGDNSQELLEHERICSFRAVECTFSYCQDRGAFTDLPRHLQSHGFLMRSHPPKYVRREGYNKFTVRLAINKNMRWTIGPMVFQDKTFYTQVEIRAPLDKIEPENTLDAKTTSLFWVQLFELRHEAKNFRYTIQLRKDGNTGSPFYNGPVKSLDDDKTIVFESRSGLEVSMSSLKKYMEDNTLTFEVEFEDTKDQNGKPNVGGSIAYVE